MCSICEVLTRDEEGKIKEIFANGSRRFVVGEEHMTNSRAYIHPRRFGKLVGIHEPSSRVTHDILVLEFPGDPTPYCYKPKELA